MRGPHRIVLPKLTTPAAILWAALLLPLYTLESGESPDLRGMEPPPQAPAQTGRPAEDVIRKRLHEAFHRYLPKLEEDGNAQRLKMEVFFRRRKGISLAPYFEILEGELQKPDTEPVRALYVQSVLAFGYSMLRESAGRSKGRRLLKALIERKAWPAGAERVREEVIRDFLRFLVMRETHGDYLSERRLVVPLLEWYLSPENKSSSMISFGPAAKEIGRCQECHNVVRRQRMKLKGHFLPLKRAGYFCGEIGQVGDCERLLKWALAVCPDEKERVEIQEKLSQFMERCKKPDKAVAYYQEAHAGDTDIDVDARLHLAGLHLKKGDKEEAEKIVASLAAGKPDNTTVYKLGRYYVLTKQYQAATDMLAKYRFAFRGDARSYNESVLAAYNLAIAYGEQKRAAEQTKLLEEVVANRRTGPGFDTFFANVCRDMLQARRRTERQLEE